MLHAIVLAVFVALSLRVSAFQQQQSFVSLHHPSFTSAHYNGTPALLVSTANAYADDDLQQTLRSKPTNSVGDIARNRLTFWNVALVASAGYTVLCLVAAAAAAAARSCAVATTISPFLTDPAVAVLVTISLGFCDMVKDFKEDVAEKLDKQERSFAEKLDKQDRSFAKKLDKQDRSFAKKLDKHQSQIALNIKDLKGDIKDSKGDFAEKLDKQERSFAEKLDKQERSLTEKLEKQERSFTEKLDKHESQFAVNIKDLKGDMTKITANMNTHELTTAANTLKLETKLNEQERFFAEKLGKQKRSLAGNIKGLKSDLDKKLDSLESSVAAITKALNDDSL